MNLLIIALGGALGAVSRFLLGNGVSRALGSALPYGTFVINIVGCFAMGLLMTIIVDREMLPAAWRLFLCVGFLGGFTTFSSFGYEALMLLTEGRLLAALAYVGGSVLYSDLHATAPNRMRPVVWAYAEQDITERFSVLAGYSHAFGNNITCHDFYLVCGR